MSSTRNHAGWTDERVETLKRLHKEGLSASEMAKTLGGITRNAAIGKCVRLGLGSIGGGKASAPAKSKAQHGTLRPKPAPRPAKQPMPKGVMVLPPMKGGSTTEAAAAARLANMEARENPAENVVLMSRSFTPLPGCAPVAFGEKGCKWPVSGAGASMLQCGAQRDGEKPYCVSHSAAAHQKPKPGAPKNGNELARSLRRWVA